MDKQNRISKLLNCIAALLSTAPAFDPSLTWLIVVAGLLWFVATLLG